MQHHAFMLLADQQFLLATPQDGAAQAVYFDRIGTGLRADVSSITIKTASGLLEATHSNVPKA
jgi:hypothetical protein